MAKKKAGRPALKTKEQLRELAKELENWLEKPDNWLLGDFLFEKSLTPTQLTTYGKRCPELSKAISRAQIKEQNFLIKEGNGQRQSMNIFLLKSRHNYQEKQEMTHNINLPKVEIILEKKKK